MPAVAPNLNATRTQPADPRASTAAWTQNEPSESAEETRSLTDTFSDWIPRAKRAKPKEMFLMCRQMALLLETGVDLTEALDLVAQQIKSVRLQECLDEIRDAISTGVSLSSAVMRQSEVLGEETAATLRAGEASGRLADTFRQLAARIEEEVQLRGTLTSALAYPLTLFGVAQIVVGVLVWFVLPQFADTFNSMAVDPPWFTQVLIDVAAFMREHLIALAVGAVIAIVGTFFLMHRPAVQRVRDRIAFSSPLLGPAIRNLATGQFFVTCGNLLQSGIPLLEAIRLVRGATRYAQLKDLADTWEAEALDGHGLTQCMSEFDFLPDGASAMLMTAEKTGKLDTVLIQAGQYYRAEGTSQIKTVLKVCEPLIILVLGVFVGGVVASVLLPMLDIQSAQL
ncbi:MAG: type II secretion system F family protein [Aureliella sp.]